jgi:hypothetical protein
MATEARYDVSKTPGAPPNSAHKGSTLTPEELAEFIDSLREDELLSPIGGGPVSIRKIGDRRHKATTTAVGSDSARDG